MKIRNQVICGAVVVMAALAVWAVGLRETAWDKVFAKSDKVEVKKVEFKNRFGIKLVGDLYQPKDKSVERHAAIAVTGPFGAVKEQASGLYAQTLAERGFVALAFEAALAGFSAVFFSALTAFASVLASASFAAAVCVLRRAAGFFSAVASSAFFAARRLPVSSADSSTFATSSAASLEANASLVSTFLASGRISPR